MFCVSGYIFSINEAERYFEICPSPYTRISKEHQAVSMCPFKVTIPVSNRWDKFPKISTGGYVTLDAFGVSVICTAESSVKSVLVELEKITLQGKPTRPTITAPGAYQCLLHVIMSLTILTATPSLIVAQGGRNRPGFNYDACPMPPQKCSRITAPQPSK